MTPATATLTRTERRKAATRAQLLQAAADVMAETGFHQAKVQDIAASADVGTGTLYNYFGSKEEIFAALIADTIDGLAQHLDAVRNADMSVEQRVWAGWRAVLEYADAHRARLRVFFGEGAGFHAFISKAHETFAEVITTDLKEAIDGGEARPCHTGIVSAAMVGMASHVVSWWLEHPEVPLEEVAEELATLEWRGLQQPGGGASPQIGFPTTRDAAEPGSGPSAKE